MTIEIRSHWDSSKILYTSSASNLLDALREAVRRGADLRGADLRDAYLRGADLGGADLVGAYLVGADLGGADLGDVDPALVLDDFRAVLDAAPNEVPALRAALVAGRVDGSTYDGECACLVGTIANARGCAYTAIPELLPDADRLAERFFLAIRPGHTPLNNEFAKQAVDWIDGWAAGRGGGPPPCCRTDSGEYAECPEHERERLEEADALASHLAMARES